MESNQGNNYWCLVSNLSMPAEEPKILPASELYKIRLKTCTRFVPKSLKFDKHEEFGIVKGNSLVKHVILAMSGKAKDLQKMLSEKQKRMSPPVRLSISATELPLSDLIFPQKSKENRKQQSDRRELTLATKRNDDEKLFSKYLKEHRGSSALQPPSLVDEAELSNQSHKKDITSIEDESVGQLPVAAQDLKDKPVNKIKKQKRKKNKKQSDVSACDAPLDQAEVLSDTVYDQSTLTGTSTDPLPADWTDTGDVEDQNQAPIQPVETVINMCEDSGDTAEDRNKAPIQPVETVNNMWEDSGDTAEGRNKAPTQPVDTVANIVNSDNSVNSTNEILECAACKVLRNDLTLSEDRLQEAYDKIKSQQQQLDNLKKKTTEEESLLEKMKSIVANTDVGKKSAALCSKKSGLHKLPSNLVAGDKEIVASTQVKVGKKLYVTRDSVEKIEKEETFFTARVDKLLDVIYAPKPYKYSVKSTSKYWISPVHIASMNTILSHMKWSRTTAFDEEKIKSRLIKQTSVLRIHHATTKGRGKGPGEKQSKKPPAQSSSKLGKRKNDRTVTEAISPPKKRKQDSADKESSGSDDFDRSEEKGQWNTESSESDTDSRSEKSNSRKVTLVSDESETDSDSSSSSRE